MKVTANGNFEKGKTWSGIKKHLEHDDKLNHSNEFLNTKESKALRKYNRREVLIDFDKWTEQKFSGYVLEHDKKAIKKSRFVFGSVESFLKYGSNGQRRSKTLDKLYSVKFSDKETWDKLIKICDENSLSKDALFCAVRDGFSLYAHGFNSRNPNLVMFEEVTHMDEVGAPHFHGRVIPFISATEAGKKPSWALNKVFQTQFNESKPKDGLHDFRKQEDQALIDAINESIEKELPELFQYIGGKFTLERKSPSVTGVKHEIYKAQKQLEDITNQVNQKQNEAKQVDKKLAKSRKKLDGLAKYESQLRELDQVLAERDANLKASEKQNQLDREQLEKDRSDLEDWEFDLANQQNQFIARDKNLSLREEKAQDKMNEATSILNDLVPSYRKAVKTLTDQQDKASEAIKKAQEAQKEAQNQKEINEQYLRQWQIADRNQKSDYDRGFMDGAKGFMRFLANKFYGFNPVKTFIDWASRDNQSFGHKILGSLLDSLKNAPHYDPENKKELERRKRDMNKDGIDDSLQASFKPIDIASVDPRLYEANQKQNMDDQDQY